MLFFKQLITLRNKIQNLVPSGLFFCRSIKYLRQLIPMCTHIFLIFRDIIGKLPFRQFINLRKNHHKRNPVFAQPVHKFQINFLHRNPRVKQHHHTHQIGPFQYIILQKLHPHFLPVLRYLSITIPRQIHQIPVSVNNKMINQLRFPWLPRSFRHIIPLAKHINKRRFPHITSPYKSIFGHVRLRAFRHIRITHHKLRSLYFHLFLFYFRRNYE